MKGLVAPAVGAALLAAAALASAIPAAAGPWGRWHGPYVYGPRFAPWGWGGPRAWHGPRRFAFRRAYGGFRGFYGGYPYGGYGGRGHQTLTGGPSGGLTGGS